MVAVTTGRNTSTEAPAKLTQYQVVIEGDSFGVMSFMEEEVSTSLAIESALFKYTDQAGHPRMNMRIVCNEKI